MHPGPRCKPTRTPADDPRVVTPPDQSGRNRASLPRRFGRAGAATLCGLVLFVGMLFWTKLRAVRHIPRSAYAVPEEPHAGAPGDDPTRTPATDEDERETTKPDDSRYAP